MDQDQDRDHLLTSTEVAEHLRVARSTLAYWRATDQGPPYLKLGTRVRYPVADLEAWLAAQQRGGAA